jgi:hypothetical protein
MRSLALLRPEILALTGNYQRNVECLDLTLIDSFEAIPSASAIESWFSCGRDCLITAKQGRRVAIRRWRAATRGWGDRRGNSLLV